jgi:hypothetical protein
MTPEMKSRVAGVRFGSEPSRPGSSLIGWYVAVAILGLASVAGAAGSADTCLAVEITARESTTALFVDGFESGGIEPWLDGSPAFSAAEISDVVFEVTAVGVFIGDSVLELKLDTPNGHLYQVLTAPVSSSQTKAAGVSKVVGFPYPLQVQHLGAGDGSGAAAGSAVTLRLPVGGTLIVRTSLYGLWELSAFLDGVPAGCDDPYRFNLVQ